MSEHRIRVIGPGEIRALVPALADVLTDCVEGGASVSFMAPFSADDARAFWEKIADAVEKGTASVLVAEVDGAVRGTVQIALDTPLNQPHRAEIKKLLVHRLARGKGLGSALMRAAEREAAERGRWLLCLDTATGGAAERLYGRLGWTSVGVIPDYALYPRGGFCDTRIFYKRLT